MLTYIFGSFLLKDAVKRQDMFALHYKSKRTFLTGFGDNK